MMPRAAVSLLLGLAFLSSGALAAQETPGAVTRDPPLDTLHPPSQVVVAIPSHGVGLNGFLYLPQGTGRHRVVVLLHGYPGVEKDLDLAQALRRAGYAVLYFDYRGSWGTGGTFSYGNAIVDAASALAWVRSPSVAGRYGLELERLSVIGHSFGGWLALVTAAADPAVTCVAAFAPGDRAAQTRTWQSRPAERAAMRASLAQTMDSQSGPIRARPGDVLRELEAHAESWALASQAPHLRDRPLLLVTGKRDTPHMVVRDTLLAALQRAGAAHVRDVVLDDDHTFSAHRIGTAQLVVDWLGQDCAR